jgi:hypothetical protein
MKTYSKFQFSWFLPAILISMLVFSHLAYRHQWGNNPMNLGSYILLQIILGGCLLLFFGINVAVDETKIKVSFGIGLISKTIKMKEIKSVEIVSNPWYYGWGIKFIPRGMLYNIAGKQAVELKFKRSKEIIRIGSAFPQELKNAIASHLIPKN